MSQPSCSKDLKTVAPSVLEPCVGSKRPLSISNEPNKVHTPIKSQKLDPVIAKPVVPPPVTHKFGRGLWLIRVPPDVGSLWLKTPENKEVGTVTLSHVGGLNQEAQVTLNLKTNSCSSSKSKIPIALPPENLQVFHKYKLKPIPLLTESGATAPIFAVFEPKGAKGISEPEKPPARVYGSIQKKFKAFPIRDQEYKQHLQKKEQSIRQSRLPIQLDKPVFSSIPISNRAESRDMKKKKECKKLRSEKEEVLHKLFGAFETKQYYTFKELITITGQPVSFLKDVLKDYCNYSTKGLHRANWELKPEYRHYEIKKVQEQNSNATSSDLQSSK